MAEPVLIDGYNVAVDVAAREGKMFPHSEEIKETYRHEQPCFAVLCKTFSESIYNLLKSLQFV